jgi:hypothetical protein
MPDRADTKSARRRTRAFVLASALASALAAVLVVLLIGPRLFSRHVLEPRLVEAVESAIPGSTCTVENLRFDIWDNTVAFESAGIATRDTSLSASVGPASLHGLRWLDLILRSNAEDGLSGARLKVRDIHLAFPHSRYMVACAGLAVSAPDSTARVDSLRVAPAESDEVFFGRGPYRKTRFIVRIPSLRVSGLDIAGAIRDSLLRIRSLEFSGTHVGIMLDKRKPAEPDSVPPMMLNEALFAVRRTVKIGGVSSVGGSLLYSELFPFGTAPGVLRFDSVFVKTNSTAADTFRIDADASFMGSAPMALRLAIPTGTPEFSFTYSGSLGKMNLDRLNPWMLQAENTRITGGLAHKATYAISVVDGRATGRVDAAYEGLVLAMVDKRTKGAGGVMATFKSFVTNRFVIRGTNMPGASGGMKSGNVMYVHARAEPYFGFLWKALRAGLGDLVGFT